MQFQDFYTELGKLLYAVAKVDGVITKEERKALMEIVEKELAPLESSTDEFGTDAAYITKFEFDVLEEQMTPAEDAFNDFIDFVEEHHKAFKPNIKSICIKVTEELAADYHGTNKKEHALIEKLKLKLSKIA
jgi:hypothetical protein